MHACRRYSLLFTPAVLAPAFIVVTSRLFMVEMYSYRAIKKKQKNESSSRSGSSGAHHVLPFVELFFSPQRFPVFPLFGDVRVLCVVNLLWPKLWLDFWWYEYMPSTWKSIVSEAVLDDNTPPTWWYTLLAFCSFIIFSLASCAGYISCIRHIPGSKNLYQVYSYAWSKYDTACWRWLWTVCPAVVFFLQILYLWWSRVRK